ncbi:Uncharacterised protein [Mycobacterium tuberculosis]|nr:Uncharacterised protein [Mycobacterium tuberculosis]
MHTAAPRGETDKDVDAGSDGYAKSIEHRVCHRE